MAKQLKDILKQAHDTIKGVRASTTTAGSTGKDPGVDYDPKAGDEQEFVAKHSVQRWDEPEGNKNQADVVKYSLDTPQNARMGNKEDEAKASYFRPVKESKKMKCESCNSMYEGASCGCGAKPVKKLEEVLTKSTTAGETISDFVHSKNPKFAGKSKEKRKEMALAAYYAKQRNEEVEQIDELSPATLSSYKSKAADSEKTLTNKSSSLSVPPKERNVAAVKANQRRIGMNLATKKLGEAVTTDNEGHGYHGTVGGNHEERTKKYAAMHAHVKKLVGAAGHLRDARQPNQMVKHFLDSPHGRHVADNPTDSTIKSHFAYFKKKYKPEHFKEDLAVPLLQSHDDSGYSMTRAELKALADKAMHLVMSMPEGMHVEPWCQAKIAQAKSMINDVHDYMLYSEKDNEQTDTPLTFPNMSVDVNTGQNV